MRLRSNTGAGQPVALIMTRMATALASIRPRRVLRAARKRGIAGRGSRDHTSSFQFFFRQRELGVDSERCHWPHHTLMRDRGTYPYPALSSASVPPAAPPTGYHPTSQRAAAPSFGYPAISRHPPHGFGDRGLNVEPQRLHGYQTQFAAPSSSQYPPVGRAPRSVYGIHAHAQLQGCNKRAVPAGAVVHATRA